MLIVLLLIICILVALIWFTVKMDSNIESAFRPLGKLTPVQGGIIHWQKQGDGPALVLIHGLLGNSNNFHELAKTLASRYTVYSVDRPGSGFSSRYKSTSASFEQQSKMLLEWMKKEDIENVAVAGHSMGGGVALRMALDAPDQIKSVSLLCPLTTPLKGGAGPLSILYIPNEFIRNTITKTIASPLRAKLGRKQVVQIFHPDSVPASFSVEGGGLLALHSRSFYEGSRDTVSAQGSLHRQQAHYGEIQCPVGVLYGENDTILKPSEHIGAVTQALSSATQKIIPGTGHMIPITQVDACADFIIEIDSRAVKAD
ncbi:alpha/beta hydrolase [Alteromonas sp. ALT199]|uniref:alpha/beta fold hydrolase n=1 Tax=unclassified Alteromonas TaxID=2614992 RepID=UPI001BEC0F7E|nr:alpha/beta hydrolase [Alteromonas sp. ALT199]MBT3134424.1 alpha/beta hydrolase [Alteromonas sp. ALT199]